MSWRSRVRTLEYLKERVFPDGYCSCSCGPIHHVMDQDPYAEQFVVSCKYHKAVCARIHVAEIQALEARF